MKKIAALLPLLHFIFLATAQTETDIRKHYIETNEKIKESIEHGFEGPLYQNQIIINKNGKSWPAVGRYDETVDFWYDDDPWHVPPADRNPKSVLLKIHVARHSLHLRITEEYLYKNGRLVFYYSNMEEEGNQWEVRVYFNSKGIAFKTSVKENEKELTAKELAKEALKDFKPNPIKIMKEAKEYQDLFLKSM